jgi:hypothetical protein
LSTIAASQSGMSGLISRIGRGVLRAHVIEDGHRITLEGSPPGAQGVERAPQAEQVGAVVERLRPGLLRCHVLRRARQDAFLRQAGVTDCPGQAEVGDLDSLHAVFEQNVGRLNVAMDQTLRMSGGQARCRLPADAEDLS